MRSTSIMINVSTGFGGEGNEEVQHEVRHGCEWRVWAGITQHTWGAVTKLNVAMVMCCYSIPEYKDMEMSFFT